MKKASSVVSSLITTLMLASVVCIQGIIQPAVTSAEYVLDTNGNPLITGERYYIQTVYGLGVTAIVSPIPFFCIGLTDLPGEPVSFRVPKASKKIAVKTSSFVNIKLESDISVFSKFWTVDISSSSTRISPWIFIFGKPEEENSWFKIEKTGNGVDANTYKFTFNYTATNFGPSNETIGAVPGLLGPTLLLTKIDDLTMVVKFIKVDNDATTSTSRVKKLGRRMFPFY